MGFARISAFCNGKSLPIINHVRLRQKGTTLVELLVTVAFLGMCVVPMLTMINSSQIRANETKARMLSLAVAQDEMDKSRITAKTAALTVGSTTTSVAVSGLPDPVSLNKTITLVAGFTNLYEVTVAATYSGGTIKIWSQMRAPGG